MKRAAALASVLIVMAGTAQAQAPAPASPAPASADPAAAAARAEADRLIAAAHAETYFSNITTDATPRVRHLPSGLDCSFSPGQPNSIQIYQTNTKPGEDVSCGTRHPMKDGRYAVETLYASRYPQTPTVRQAMSGIVASIRVQAPEAKVAVGNFNTTAPGDPGPDAPLHMAARFELSANNQRLFTRAAASVVRGWVISQRITAPIEDAEPADALGELRLGLAVVQVQRASIDETDIAARQITAQDAASDEAHRLLKTIRDQDAFANLTAEGTVRLQHKASGVICRFSRNPAVNRLAQTPNGFNCGSGRDFGAESLEVSYLPGAPSADVAGMVERFVAAQFSGAKPLAGFGDVKAATTAGIPFPEHTSQRFAAETKEGAKVFVRISYATVGDWLVFQRVVGAAANARIVDLQGERDMIDDIFQIVTRQNQAARIGPPPKGR